MSNGIENEISHIGTIERIQNSIIYVRIISTASCVSCSANGSCSASDLEEKIIEVAEPKNHNHSIGATVFVTLQQSAGTQAVLLGYVYPLIVLVTAVMIFLNVFDNQGVAGLLALLTLIPYYLILYLTRKKQERYFSFKIK
jgi:sigma-E factor negative regulatory protein RseC